MKRKNAELHPLAETEQSYIEINLIKLEIRNFFLRQS